MKNRKTGLLGSVMVPLVIVLAPFTLESSTAAAVSATSDRLETTNRAALPKAVMRLAAKCGACKACNPCNPCGGGSASDKCAVPRLQQAAVNPCAVKKSCNPCAPKGCAPKTCAPKGCAAKNACSGCNPCGAKKSLQPLCCGKPLRREERLRCLQPLCCKEGLQSLRRG